MRLAFISGNLTNGGAQRVISVVSSRLAERGHEVYLYVFSRGEKEYGVSDKVYLTYMAQSKEEYEKISSLKRFRNLREFLKESKPQAAVGFMEAGYALYMASLGLPVKRISAIRANPKSVFSRKGLRAWLNRKWFDRSDAVAAQTEAQKCLLPGNLKAKACVIPNPVSDDALENAKTEYGDKCLKLIMAGRLVAVKNYPMVFEAVSKVHEKYPGITLDIYGSGKLQDELQEKIGGMGLSNSIKLCGWSENTAEEFKKRDIYILSSDNEGMPNSLMEAMAVGLPCISTDCETGPADLIKDKENGFLIPCGDSGALADRIIKLVEMTKEERQTMGERAHKTMQNGFGSDIIAQKWEKFFEEIIGRR
ncbi:MAG: glycosyltransferase family 4 protein [Clostridia bacterium]|nr:glycosyltransferase family 4 protein [Clostridia bacterium]